MVITANSGYGKSTFLYKVQKEFLSYSANLLGKNQHLPILIDLPKVIDKIFDPKINWKIDNYLEEFGLK